MAARKLPPPDDRPPKKLTEEDEALAEAVVELSETELVVPETEGRNRKELASECELNPHSLVGSWFIRCENGEAIWWGIVIGEPQAGTYLCQIDSGLQGGTAQVVFTLERMEAKDEGYEFRFFDTQDAMRSAYVSLAPELSADELMDQAERARKEESV